MAGRRRPEPQGAALRQARHRTSATPSGLELGLHFLDVGDRLLARLYGRNARGDLRLALRFDRAWLRTAATRRVVATMLSGGFEARSGRPKSTAKSPPTRTGCNPVAPGGGGSGLKSLTTTGGSLAGVLARGAGRLARCSRPQTERRSRACFSKGTSNNWQTVLSTEQCSRSLCSMVPFGISGEMTMAGTRGPS